MKHQPKHTSGLPPLHLHTAVYEVAIVAELVLITLAAASGRLLSILVLFLSLLATMRLSLRDARRASSGP
jgi:hypothetical protein